MIELNRRYIVDEVHVPGADLHDFRWHDMAVHERKGVVGESRTNSGDQAAGKRHDENQRGERHRTAKERPGPRIGSSRWPQQRERGPEHRREDQQCEAEMRSEPQLRHTRVVDQTALHHVPAQCSLRSAEQENPEQHRRQTGRGRNLSACDEPQQRHDEREPYQAPEQAVDIFHPEDAFERVDAHATIDLQVFRRHLIFGKRLVPLRLRQRRQGADDGLPFGNRQP